MKMAWKTTKHPFFTTIILKNLEFCSLQEASLQVGRPTGKLLWFIFLYGGRIF